MAQETLITIEQAAEELGLDRSQVRRLCQQGKIAGARKFGGVWIIHGPLTYARRRSPKVAKE